MKLKIDVNGLVRGFLIALVAVIAIVTLWNYLSTTRQAAPIAKPQDLHLAAHLLMAQGGNGVVELDMATGSVRTLFQPSSQGLVNEAVLSPDGSTIVLAYAAPSGPIQFGYTDLYSMPADGSSQPKLLVAAGSGNLLYNPAWSPDGHYLYYARIQGGAFGIPQIDLLRMAYPGGQPQVVLANAHAPAISPDGTQIAYVFRDSTTYQENLYLAAIDGSKPVALLSASKFATVDTPRFSPDGKTLIFSSPAEGGMSRPQREVSGTTNWFDSLFGVRIAQAHSIPSDLWSIAAAGGQPTRLTSAADYGLSADFSPDGQFIAFVSGSGIYVMKPDGSQLTRISDQSIQGSLEWVP